MSETPSQARSPPSPNDRSWYLSRWTSTCIFHTNRSATLRPELHSADECSPARAAVNSEGELPCSSGYAQAYPHPHHPKPPHRASHRSRPNQEPPGKPVEIELSYGYSMRKSGLDKSSE